MKNLVLAFFLIGLTGCAGLMNGGFPPPRAGMVVIINPNIGAYANYRIFNGNWSEDQLITVDEQGHPKWAIAPVKTSTVKSATCTYAHYASVLDLPYPANYTLYVIWTRFTGKVLDRSIITFQTSGKAMNNSYTDQFGQKTYADKFIHLPSVNTSGLTQLKIHATIPLAEYLGTLIGIR